MFQANDTSAQQKDTIQKGYLFSHIAQKHGISKEELRCGNLELTPIRDEAYKKLKKGYELKIPPKVKKGRYLITLGDNPGKIIAQYNITLEELKALNPNYKPLIEKGNVNRCEIINVPILDDDKGITLGEVTTTPTHKDSPITSASHFFYKNNISLSRNKKYLICKVHPKEFNIEVFSETNEKQIHDIHSIQKLKQKSISKLLFAINAGMFEPNRRPVGLLIQQGERKADLNLSSIGHGNFYSLPPNGVFAIDENDKAIIVSTDVFRKKHARSFRTLKLATQSGPMMVIDGKFNKAFNKGSRNKHIRNAVGITQGGEVIFVISKVPVNFYEFSELLRDELKCSDALYLDGAISQAWIRKEKQLRSVNGRHTPLGPILTISKK